MIITLVFKKNANFFRRKLGKIAENCDHNIDPGCFLQNRPMPSLKGPKLMQDVHMWH
jgi:hypothetical protein